ncbi:YjjI family glycine radical enzyme [Texcoconibacillus texcoconensis]|uniref:YjjI family glycine radical enzyme n=1 Tax=Texcoconibacillus texcoconensis TaxID=1095777 RepID=A0A840QM91_9BACI|nr:YjjI family glycine radical enzyme [Texcoconibacillus texcoconensis]MBB5172461.1 YjjI family glycine radical enzyme [Texcoconibacillus texcoconensis]
MSQVLDMVTSQKLTYEQKVMSLAHAAEDTLSVLNIPEKTRYYFEINAIDDLYEGSAPYRPRYIMPDYEHLLTNGSEFLRIEPPEDIDELLNSLMIFYKHVPSITGFPVYLGNIDKLIEPFLDGVSDKKAKKKLRLFLNYLDRTITDSFCHANIGPEATRAGKLILELEKELQNAVPNFTLKYDPAITPDDYAELAVHASLYCANPAFCNHHIHQKTYPTDYGISSCYNILPIGGGAHTLSRITLPGLANVATSTEQFLYELLPDCLEALGGYMNERIRFLVEQSGFFESSFLVKEGFIDANNFIGMLGITGLAECTNILMGENEKRYGHDSEADDLAEQIMKVISNFAAQFPAKYSNISGGQLMLHAQVGMDYDIGITSGVRIPVSDELENIYDHLRHSARFHREITTGCGDIFPIETTGRNNPSAILDIVKGAFSLGSKYMSFYEENSDLVRITGYLVKRSEMEKYRDEQVVLQNTTQLGTSNYDHNHLKDRKVRGV